MDLELIILSIVLFFVSLATTYGIGKLILYLKERSSKETLLMRRIKELAEEIKYKESEKREEMKEELEVFKVKQEPKTINEILALTKVLRKVIFYERDLTVEEFLALRKLGLIKHCGEYYLITKEAFEVAKKIHDELEKALSYNLTEREWELLENGIRALGVIYMHETEGPMLIPIADPFTLFRKLKISVMDLAMLDEESIMIGSHRFVLIPVKVSERREKEHIIIAEIVSDKAKDFLKNRSLEILTEAKRRIGERS